MANVTAPVNVDRLSELTLEVLTTVGVPLKAFTTDLTSSVAQRGDVVSTRYADVPSTKDFSVAANRQPDDRDLTEIKVTLDQYKGVPLGFTDLERSYTDFELIQFWIEPAVSAIVENIITDALSLADATNVTNTKTVTAAAFDADEVADLAEGLSTRKVSRAGRAMIVPPSYMAGLVKDAKVTAASDNVEGRRPLQESAVARLHGFDIYEYNGAIPANSRNMTALALQPQAICIAARQIAAPQDGTWYGSVQTITDPNSGLSIQMRAFYDNVVQRYEFSALWGVNTDPTAGSKATAIVSA